MSNFIDGQGDGMAHGESNRTDAIDANTPSVARMYDWLLGGVENYHSDREACMKLLEIAPQARSLARDNRAFLRRVVRVLVEEYNVEQFIDHGSGLPAEGNVHQVAQGIDPQCRVVYIDNDPTVLAHGRTILQENDNTAVIHADMRETGSIFQHEDVRRLIRPHCRTAALFVSVLHCLPDTGDRNDPAALIQRVAGRLKPGDLMVICQLVSTDPSVRERVTRLMLDSTGGRWGRVREQDEVRAYFNRLTILEPGLGDVVDWRPDGPPLPVEQRAPEWVEWGGLARV
ncbi:SAM-dependent methyltransferase [Streptomyces netropsis]|uniref:SAM-dependent methyltransferase n=1 Tax=Streptomyces netropsis TaxID=55404 RepID=UPI0030D17915